jgi:hypothetical protein
MEINAVSRFGLRMAQANAIVDAEYADDFIFVPMCVPPNGDPIPDGTRTGGTVSVTVLQPGMQMGSGWSLNAMHTRASSDITLWFMARGVLANAVDGHNVRKNDEFRLAAGATYPERRIAYQVADGPLLVGFGRYKCTVVEVYWPPDPEPEPDPDPDPEPEP